MSLFKVPQLKTSKLIENRTVAKNSTLNTLFSINFNPPKASTPLDGCEQGIVLTDPHEVLFASENGKDKKEPKNAFKNLLEQVDQVSKNIDEKCFENADPISNIVKTIQQHHDSSLEDSKIMNATEIQIEQNVEENASLPIPAFYEPVSNLENYAVMESIFNYTPSLVQTPKSNAFNFDITISKSNVLSSNAAGKSPNVFFNFDSDMLSPFAIEKIVNQNANETEWWKENKMSVDDQWNMTSINKIFHLPPKRSKIQEKFSQAFNEKTPDFIDDSTFIYNNLNVRELNISRNIFDNICDF
jgi:hypothetical protein